MVALIVGHINLQELTGLIGSSRRHPIEWHRVSRRAFRQLPTETRSERWPADQRYTRVNGLTLGTLPITAAHRDSLLIDGGTYRFCVPWDRVASSRWEIISGAARSLPQSCHLEFLHVLSATASTLGVTQTYATERPLYLPVHLGHACVYSIVPLARTEPSSDLNVDTGIGPRWVATHFAPRTRALVVQNQHLKQPHTKTTLP